MANDKIVGEILKCFSSKNVESAKNAILQAGNITPGLKISYYVSDENTKRYVKKLGLDTPQKLARFLVDVGFSEVEALFDSVNEVQVDIMNDHLSKIKSVRQKIKHSILSDDANKRLIGYQDELIDLRNIFERRVSENIDHVIKIDNMSSIERKIRAIRLDQKIDMYTKSAKVCLQAVLEISKLQTYIADYVGDSNFDVIRCDIEDFMNQTVFKDNTISLMNDWSTKEDRNYWSDSLRKDYIQTMEQHGELMELFADLRNVAEKQNVDLENIIFE